MPQYGERERRGRERSALAFQGQKVSKSNTLHCTNRNEALQHDYIQQVDIDVAVTTFEHLHSEVLQLLKMRKNNLFQAISITFCQQQQQNTKGTVHFSILFISIDFYVNEKQANTALYH